MTTPVSSRQGSTWVQTGSVDFSHSLTGADHADELISEVPQLQIPFPGLWEIAYHARSYIGLTSSASLYVRTALFKNGVLIPNTEALTGIQGANQAIQSTPGQTVLETFVAGDVVTLHAYRIGTGTASIISNPDGRTGVMAHWVSPGF